ncbi:Polyketide synthase PksJ [Allorhodopirellula heiligendammensis]|uniref:Polyketide synthase PksJ n=1 Tax=Allorhodopirellula heiligendammensis TaxID=2714739 RepID=A0A5C6BGY2_9BACT|nr:Polyketide synthase PksJ [Allorhodopirellula heiligendammensis]
MAPFSYNWLVDYETGIELPTQVSDVWTPSSNEASNVSTLVHYCRNHARGKTAQLPAFTHVIGEPGEHERLSFRQLDARARAIAAEIQLRGGVGKPVLVVLDPGADYAASLFGCLYARAIAVPIYPPQMLRLQHTLPRLKAIIENAGAKIMLSDRATIGDSVSSLWQMPDDGAIAVDEIGIADADRWDCQLPKPDDVALLQYTSGSTGNPRGVVLTHRTLLSNLSAIIERIHFDGARSVQWVPPYHDMGLIGGILLPICRGVETVIISPADFVRNPLLWLRCIDYYNGSSNGAPNFGYELCVRRIDHAECDGLDLSSWKVAVAGAEPVRASTLRRFEEKFARYGFGSGVFSPAYGMAETTVMATGSRLGEPYKTFHADAEALQLGEVQLVSPSSNRLQPSINNPNRTTSLFRPDGTVPTLELVSSGTPISGLDYEIVDPQTHQVLPDGRVGEIWIQGSSVASGYWRDEEATEFAFRAKLARSPDEKLARGTTGSYLRTGDLAARVEGELIVTGRLKELIIVAGRNFYPHDIEQIVQSTSEAFKPDTGTALSIDNGESEEMVVIQELWRPKKFPAAELLPLVVAAIAEQAQVTPQAVVLVRSGSLPKTSSGKLRRTDTKKLFLDGELIEIARWESGDLRSAPAGEFDAPRTSTEKRIADIWSRILDMETISRDDDFFHLGGESLLIANMLLEVSEQFSTSVPMSALFQSPKLVDFAATVDSRSCDERSSATISSTGMSLSDKHPLSTAQQRFWLLDQLGQTNAFIHVPISIHLDQPISKARLEAACQRMLDRHPMLRARIIEGDGDVWQTISDAEAVPIESFDGNSHPENELASASRDFLTAPFNLSDAPLMRVATTLMPSGGSRIDMVFHHLVCDASSLQILLGELQSYFADDASEMLGGGADGKPASAMHYVDFAAWDRGSSRCTLNQSRLNYWIQRLAGMPTELNLPQLGSLREGRQAAATTSGRGPISASISESIAKRIDQLATSLQMTPSMVYLTAYELVLARYSNSTDFGITIPTSNRPSSDLQNTIGCFVNPIVYRAQVDHERTVADTLSNTRTSLLSDLDHADVPFQDVVTATGGSRDPLRMPLSQVMFLYQPPVASITHIGDVNVVAVSPDYSAVTAYDLSLIIQPAVQTELTLVVGEQVSRDLGERILASIESVIHQFAETIDAVDGPTTVVAERGVSRDFSPVDLPARLTTISAAEKDVIAAAEQGTTLGRDTDEFVIDRLREHAAQQPNAIAIRDDQRGLTYRDVNELSDLIAGALLREEVSARSLVALEMPRSVDAIVAIIGIWKAAAAYVPIELDLPTQRRDQIIADAGPVLVLNQVRFDAWTQGAEQSEVAANSLPNHASDLAYVMYTSGSTGTPKGVAITHGNLSNLLASFADQPGLTATDSMFAVTTMSFDISLLEMFLPLWCGGHVCMTAHRIGDDPESVIEAIAQSRPTVIQSTPSGFRMLLSTNWQPAPATRLFCGGEPLLPDLARDLLATNCELWNVYGPTETTVWSMIKRIESADDITIGRPIAGTICRVVDRHGQRTPFGVAGELEIGGAGVASGYWQNETQTNQQFFTDQGTRFYKTGDHVCRRPDGDLEFLARSDRQIKLRGFRIELDEIESVLQQCDGVDRAAVVLREGDVPGGSRVVAFCCGPGSVASTVDQLTLALPDYMIPASIVWLDSLPQTAAGKTNYKSLPIDSQEGSDSSSLPPQTPLEVALAELWCEVLGCQTVGRHDHFFDLGGNSLMAAQLFARLRQRFDVQLPLKEVYLRPTIAALAEAIVMHQAETEEDDLNSLLGQLDSLSDDEVIRALDETSQS